MEEQMEVAPVIAAEVEETVVNHPSNSTHDARFNDLEHRGRALEEALAEMRKVHASAVPVQGRKTALTAWMAAKGEAAADRAGALDASLASLSVEQRIAVKSGMMRAGLL